MNNPGEIKYYFKKNYQNKIGIFVKLISKVFMKWKNWREFKSYESMNFREEDWSKIRTLLMNSRPEFRNYRMKSVVWMIREILKMLSQHAKDYPTFPVNRCYFHFIVILRNYEADTHAISGNVVVNPPASSSSLSPGGFNPWIPNVTEHISPHVTSERQIPDTALDPRCQSGPSARNSFDPNEDRFSKDYGADQQRLQISELHFDKFSTPTTYAFWKIRFKNWGMYLFTISYGSYAMDQRSGDGWISGWSQIFAFYQRNSWARISVVWRENCFSIEQNHPAVWRKWKLTKKTVSFEDDRSLTWSTNASGSLGPMILSNKMMQTHFSLFFEMMTFRNSIQNVTKFCCLWHKSHLMTSRKSLYNLRIRECEKLKTVLELYSMEIHQKSSGLDYHRLKTMVKRSIEQSLRMKNFEARNGNFETSAVVKNQREKQREQRSLGDCWQWKANGLCSKGDNCSFRHDMNKRAKSTQPNFSPGFFYAAGCEKCIENQKS